MFSSSWQSVSIRVAPKLLQLPLMVCAMIFNCVESSSARRAFAKSGGVDSAKRATNSETISGSPAFASSFKLANAVALIGLSISFDALCKAAFSSAVRTGLVM